MLNMLSDLEAAAAARMSFGAGACLRLGAVRTAQPHTGPALSGRTRAFWASDVFGQRQAAAGRRRLAWAAQPVQAVQAEQLHGPYRRG